MNTTTAELDKLAAALAKAQKHFTPIKKKQTAKVSGTSPKTGKPYSYEYKYADLSEIMDSVRGPLADQDLVVLQDVVIVDGTHWLTTSLLHSSAQCYSNAVPIIAVAEGGPQGFGISMSYARRYGMSALLALTAEDDTDGHGSGAETGDHFTISNASGGPAEHAGMKAARTVQELVSLMNGLGADEKRLYKGYFDVRRVELSDATAKPAAGPDGRPEPKVSA